jgi:AcrR family transcriptional regulator
VTGPEAPSGSLDGRVLRRQRNVDAVIDAVLEMFAEESLFPTIEQAAARSGLSLRSLYRYFADPGELLEAAIKRSRDLGVEASHLAAIGQGPLAARIDDFVAMRIRLHGTVGPIHRATVANAARLPRIRDELARNRHDLREQFELQFAAELTALKPSDRAVALSAGDLLTQLDSIEFLRRYRGLSVPETGKVLRSTLHLLLG